MKTKLVTGYWMDISGPPYYGANPARKDRYLGSLRSHCQGFPDCSIVCYTHAQSLPEVQNLKDTFNLDNLTIKIKELNQTRYFSVVEEYRKAGDIINQFPELDGRTIEVLWTKFEVLQAELTDDADYVYWVDVGLQNPSIFPWMYCPHSSKPGFNSVPLDQWNFINLFNQTIINKANSITKGKIITLVGTDRQNAYYELDGHSFRQSTWPIAGFFGGDKEVVNEYCSLYWEYADKHIANGILCVEQSIMKYANDMIHPTKLLEFSFQTHQNGTQNLDYHYELWESYEKHGVKPLYMVWHDILNYPDGKNI